MKALCTDVLDAVKGDVLGTAFSDRQARVRDVFDPLETAWRAALDDVLEQAAALPLEQAVRRLQRAIHAAPRQ